MVKVSSHYSIKLRDLPVLTVLQAVMSSWPEHWLCTPLASCVSGLVLLSQRLCSRLHGCLRNCKTNFLVLSLGLSVSAGKGKQHSLSRHQQNQSLYAALHTIAKSAVTEPGQQLIQQLFPLLKIHASFYSTASGQGFEVT